MFLGILQKSKLSLKKTKLSLKKDRVSVVVATPEETHGFPDTVVQHVRAHPLDHHLVSVDENLDIIKESGDKSTVSGSQSIVDLRQTLHAEGLEAKLLAIVRSANDSSADRAFYRDRAHGFLAKMPLSRDKVPKTLAPIWLDRVTLLTSGHPGP